MKPMGTKTLETDRLILRAWRDNDLADFYEYAKVDGIALDHGCW